ncbi:MAG TPA: hypothetical protein VEY30_12620 [Myxococcaceae bacterium]|nr:hypothetical protein [Myxococcaceae bacterium]
MGLQQKIKELARGARTRVAGKGRNRDGGEQAAVPHVSAPSLSWNQRIDRLARVVSTARLEANEHPSVLLELLPHLAQLHTELARRIDLELEDLGLSEAQRATLNNLSDVLDAHKKTLRVVRKLSEAGVWFTAGLQRSLWGHASHERFEEYADILLKLYLTQPETPVLSASGDPLRPLTFDENLVESLPPDHVLDQPRLVGFLEQMIMNGAVFRYDNIGHVVVPEHDRDEHARLYGLISRMLGQHVPWLVFQNQANGELLDFRPEAYLADVLSYGPELVDDEALKAAVDLLGRIQAQAEARDQGV